MGKEINRIRLNRLYSENNIFEEITFHDGVNILLGEKYDDRSVKGRKTNGVGKSMSIEFLDFCFLNDYEKSRIVKIPKEVFPVEENVILDLDIGQETVTIKRNRKQADKPILIRAGKTVSFDKIQDARDYLTGIIFSKLNGKKVPSFRNLFSILMRDERSEFTDIIKCHDLTKKIPDDLSAHLYLLGFSLEAYKNTIETIREIEAVSTVLTKEKKELTQDGKKKISDVRAELNALEDELQKLEDAIESFKTNESFNAMEADLIELEDLLDQLRKRQKALRYDYEKIRKMPKPEQIDDREIKKIIDDFTDTILQIHEFIMGNKECSFSIQTIDKARRKTPVELTLRIYDDGSHSVDRTKVFIYDMALLFNQYTRDRHPLFLVHDNIFDVDQDTLVQCLNYLYKQEEQYQDFQYILTLNRDKIESEEQRKLIQMNIDEHQVAVFTKKKKFLGRDYQEK